jgi:hypothetical protein
MIYTMVVKVRLDTPVVDKNSVGANVHIALERIGYYQNSVGEVNAAQESGTNAAQTTNSSKPETSSQCVLLADNRCPYKITNTCIGCDQFALA